MILFKMLANLLGSVIFALIFCCQLFCKVMFEQSPQLSDSVWLSGYKLWLPLTLLPLFTVDEETIEKYINLLLYCHDISLLSSFI